MNIIYILLLALSTQPQATIPNKGEIISQGKLTPREIMLVKAAEYNVSPKLLDKIITCESGWQQYVQSRHIYPADVPKANIKKGTRERSFGPAQINLDWNTNVTYAQATDWHFSMDFLAKNVAQGKGKLWSCFPKKMPIIVK